MTGSDYKHEMIRALRKLSGMTQAELAEKAGVSRMMISLAEKGSYLHFDRLKLIAEAFGIQPKDLLRDTVPEKTFA